MRLLVIILTILLFLGILGFVLTNLETRVSVTFFERTYAEVSLFGVVFLAILVGIVYTGIIAVAEGAHIRFENRKLTREIQKLETELTYLRTQHAPAPPPEPDAVAGPPARVEERRDEPPPPSRPVYSPDDEDGDDAYTGGRAV